MGAPDGIGTSPLTRRAPQSYADVQREADAFGEAIGLSAELGADSWLRAGLLERLLRLERRLARRASAPYRYWQLRPSGERSPLATALAEVYLETGQFAKAIDWARHGYRPDLEARAMLASGDVGGALTALERLVWADWGPPSKRVGRVYAAALLSAIDESDPSASMRTFPHLTKALLATFGSWATLEFEAVQGHPRAEPWLPACAPRAVQASEYACALALGEERLKARREREAQLARCYSLARRGRFAEAEESARSLFDPSRSDRFEIETLITEILVATERYAEAIERLTSRYLRGSHEKDLLFNLKLALDIEITGADLIRNFYFFIEPRSLLFDRLHDRYIEEAALSLAEFVLASGTDPFRRFVHEAQGRDVLYTWAHHGPRVAHGSRAKQIWKRFPPWYCFAGNSQLEAWLRAILSDLEARVCARLGISPKSERWKNEQALFVAVREILGGDRVKRGVSPAWLRPQHLDIFVPDLNLGIEYMGVQHFEPVDFFGGETAFRETVARDQRKEQLCKLNGVELVHVRFDQDWTALLDMLRLRA